MPSPSEHTERFELRLPPELRARVDELAARKGMSTADFVRSTLLTASAAAEELTERAPAGAEARGRVLHDATRHLDTAHIAPPAEQAERWRMLQRGEAKALAERMGFKLDSEQPAEVEPYGVEGRTRRKLTELERYPTVTTAGGRTYAAQPWPDE